jgi:hypothetical protein
MLHLVYERESKMKIEELAETIAAIRVKEAQEKKQKQEAIEREAIKPIYVMGQKISFDNLGKRIILLQLFPYNLRRWH